jgi:predicted DNA-binding transcriptional regulator AlpA
MPSQNEYSFSIPRHLIEDMAEEIATRVTTRLLRQITATIAPPSQPIQGPEESIRPTFIRLKGFIKRTGLSRGTIYRKVSEGIFPPSVNLGPRSVAWRRTYIELWESNPTGYSTPQ